MKIIWSALAKDYYLMIIEQLYEKWNLSIVEKFEKETTNDENEHVCHEKMILDVLQVELFTEVMLDYCIICCQDYKVGELIVWSSNSKCQNKFH